jgi:Family of unknown function (DUF5947)
MTTAVQPSSSAFALLRRYIKQSAEVEHCELCGAVVAPEHSHVIDPIVRKLACSCEPCAILFANGDGKYRRIPRRICSLAAFQMSDAQWDSLMVPIGLAFFFYNSPEEKMVAMYPSPAGPTESLLTLQNWTAITDANPLLREMEPDVEALLVNRVGKEEYFLVPIDQCFKLTGLIRAHWRGLSGGTEVWQEIEKFFAELKKNSIVKGERSA